MTPAAIKRAVATHYGVTVANLIGQHRHPTHAHPRAVAMYLIRKQVNPTPSYQRIGQLFGGRNHTSVRTAIEKIALAATSDGSALTKDGAQLLGDFATIEARLAAPAVVETFHHVRFGLGDPMEGYRDLNIEDNRGAMLLIKLSPDDRRALAALLLKGL